MNTHSHSSGHSMKPGSHVRAAMIALLSLLVAVFTGCAPKFPSASTVNPDTSFNVTDITLEAESGGTVVSATWTDADGDNTGNAANTSLAKLVLKPSTTYNLVIKSVAVTPVVNYSAPKTVEEISLGSIAFTATYPAYAILNGKLFPDVVNGWPSQFLVRAESTTAGLIASMTNADNDTYYLEDVFRKSKPVNRKITLTTGTGTPSLGNLTVQILRRVDKSSLTDAPNKPGVDAPLASNALGTSIEDVKATFTVEVKN